MSRVRRSVFSKAIEKPQAKKALIATSEKYISVCVEKICEQHKVDTETALTVLMAQCAKQMVKPSHKVQKSSILSELSTTKLGKRIAQGDLEKLPVPDLDIENAQIIKNKNKQAQETSQKSQLPFLKKIF